MGQEYEARAVDATSFYTIIPLWSQRTHILVRPIIDPPLSRTGLAAPLLLGTNVHR